jgi:hypothetical protein
MDESREVEQALYICEFATAGELVDIAVEALSDMDVDDARDIILSLLCNKVEPRLIKTLLEKINEQDYIIDRASNTYQQSLKED